MKKFLGSALGLTLALTSVALPAKADRLVKIITDQDGDIFYVDPRTIEGNGQFRYYWTVIIFAEPDTEKFSRPAYGVAAYKSADCKTRVFRVRRLEALDRNAKPIATSNPDDEGELIFALPSSAEDNVLNYVCNVRK